MLRVLLRCVLQHDFMLRVLLRRVVPNGFRLPVVRTLVRPPQPQRHFAWRGRPHPKANILV